MTCATLTSPDMPRDTDLRLTLGLTVPQQTSDLCHILGLRDGKRQAEPGRHRKCRRPSLYGNRKMSARAPCPTAARLPPTAPQCRAVSLSEAPSSFSVHGGLGCPANPRRQHRQVRQTEFCHRPSRVRVEDMYGRHRHPPQ